MASATGDDVMDTVLDGMDEAAPSRVEAWRTGGWTDVLHAFSSAPDEASIDLYNAASAIMDSVARALEASEDEGPATSSSCRASASWVVVAVLVTPLKHVF